MASSSFLVTLERNPAITMEVMSGHFTTSIPHLSHYLNVSALKSNTRIAREVARELAAPYLATTLIDTIVCLEKTEVIGAFLAEELTAEGVAAVNGGREMFVVTPLSNNVGHLFFQGSMVNHITGKNVLLLTASISSGRTVDGAMDCIAYYNGSVAGISSIFLADPKINEPKINSLFTSEHIPGYKLYNSRKCAMCKAGQKLDALISAEGYSKI